jgi:tRNA pseudouridine38-40 synthase
MPHWKLILAYDGTPYNGWQVQPNLPTVQGTLAEAIHRITGETVLPQGSGRTDTGVHALAQVTSFSLTVPIPATNLHRALNRALPPSIRILSIEAAPEDFHARHSARRKTYEYRIATDEICSPMLAPYVWNCHLPLDLTKLQQAAAHILGTHDFTSFAAVDPDLTTRTKQDDGPGEDNAVIQRSLQQTPNVVISTEGAHSFIVSTAVEKPASLPRPSPTPNTPDPRPQIPVPCIRTIYHSTWYQESNLLIYRVTGSGFLHHMVRNLVGTFVEAGCNRISPDDIPTILAARNRNAAGPTAPARGLFLVEVEYK